MHSLVPVLVLLLFCIVSVAIGRRFPNADAASRIEREAVMRRLSVWFEHRTWTCVAVTEEPGPFGCPVRVAVLESGSSRVLFCNMGNCIAEGRKVKLRRRTPEEMRSGCWFSLVDEYMAPVLM